MRKEYLKKERLDEIGRKLLKTSGINGDDLERIVSAPHLFDSIKTRIRTEQAEQLGNLPAAVITRPAFSFRLWQIPPAFFAASFAVLVIAAMSAIGIFLYRQQPVAVATQDHPVNTVTVDKAIQPLPVSITAQPAVNDPEPEFKNTTLLYHETAKAKPGTRTNYKKKDRSHSENSGSDPDDEFYPLTYTGNPGEISSGAQVVRVDLPRSSLAAMGVVLPVENGPDTVKADLLISSDGVTRGVRFVK